MKIAVYGCSWSQGLSLHDYSSWVTELASVCPEHEFYNYSYGGSSVLYQIHLMENTKADFKIFQVSAPGRLTWWDDVKDHSKYLTQIRDNVWGFRSVNINHRINTGTIASEKFKYTKPEIHKFGKMYYSLIENNYFVTEHIVHSYYAIKKSDYCFCHTSSVNGLDSVYDTLGKEKFESFVIDNGNHFGKEGQKWQAKWIKEKI